MNIQTKHAGATGLLCCTGLLCYALCVPVHGQEAASNSLDAPLAGIFEELAQTPDGPPPTPEHTGVKAMFKGLLSDFEHLPSTEDAIIAGVGGGLALAVHPADNTINAHLVGSPRVHAFFVPGKIAGALPTLLSVAIITYAVGRTKDEPKVSHVGMDLIRSLVVSEVLTQTIKYTVQRERPDGSGANSFPSGHSADTFAFATALERHLGWRGAVPAYLIASYVAMSRLHENRHYASDVVFGAAVGIISGRTVTRHGRTYYSADLQFVPGGMALAFVRHTPS